MPMMPKIDLTAAARDAVQRWNDRSAPKPYEVLEPLPGILRYAPTPIIDPAIKAEMIRIYGEGPMEEFTERCRWAMQDAFATGTGMIRNGRRVAPSDWMAENDEEL